MGTSLARQNATRREEEKWWILWMSLKGKEKRPLVLFLFCHFIILTQLKDRVRLLLLSSSSSRLAILVAILKNHADFILYFIDSV